MHTLALAAESGPCLVRPTAGGSARLGGPESGFCIQHRAVNICRAAGRWTMHWTLQGKDRFKPVPLIVGQFTTSVRSHGQVEHPPCIHPERRECRDPYSRQLSIGCPLLTDIDVMNLLQYSVRTGLFSSGICDCGRAAGPFLVRQFLLLLGNTRTFCVKSQRQVLLLHRNGRRVRDLHQSPQLVIAKCRRGIWTVLISTFSDGSRFNARAARP